MRQRGASLPASSRRSQGPRISVFVSIDRSVGSSVNRRRLFVCDRHSPGNPPLLYTRSVAVYAVAVSSRSLAVQK